ncbi:unnamed protein product [Haemonchus placei]|uniref:Transposase n=1 Tax=Haemonchus placei TaxID=6290 RepID=A0A158QPT5_HAEPC|nr:unnamed protein product [Haemonchus placei]
MKKNHSPTGTPFFCPSYITDVNDEAVEVRKFALIQNIKPGLIEIMFIYSLEKAVSENDSSQLTVIVGCITGHRHEHRFR